MLITEVLSAENGYHTRSDRSRGACGLPPSVVAGTTPLADPARLVTSDGVCGCLSTLTEVDVVGRFVDAPSRRSASRLPVPVEPQGAHVTIAGDQSWAIPKERPTVVPVVEEVASRMTPLVFGEYASRVEPDDTSRGVRRPFGDSLRRSLYWLT
jgi:hypothetical protein